MKSYFLRKDKWYQSNYTISIDSELVGEVIAESYKKTSTINLFGTEFSIKNGSLWKSEKFIYQGNVKYAEIIQKTFSNKTIIALQNGDQYSVIQHPWKGSFTLLYNEKDIAEYKGKRSNNILTIGDTVSLPITAAFLHSITLKNNAYIAFVALIPIFIVVFS